MNRGTSGTRLAVILAALMVVPTALPFSPDSSAADPGVLPAEAGVMEAPLAAYQSSTADFEKNVGQFPPEVLFATRSAGGLTYFAQDHVGTVLATSPPAPAPFIDHARGMDAQAFPSPDLPPAPPTPPVVLRMEFPGANMAPVVEGLDELLHRSNYYIGNDPAQWYEHVPHYARVQYTDLYPGIDLVFYGTPDGGIKYDFVVAPGADPAQIRLSFHGADALRLDAGALVIATPAGDVRHAAPITYQGDASGARLPVASAYALHSEGAVAFSLGTYDSARTLVIDPVLSYSTYLGGSGGDSGYGIAADGSGNAYITGSTSSLNFPTLNPAQPTRAGGADAFVTKLTPTGALSYSTYLGGKKNDHGNGIAVDANGNAYITGSTPSTNFPTLNPSQPTHAGGWDAFVTKLTPTGALSYSTYLGGTGSDQGNGIAVDGSGNAYIAGRTHYFNFPTLNPAQPTNAGAEDVFVTKLTPTGALSYSTYLGGNGDDLGFGIAVDGNGNAYITGYTASTNFPTLNPSQPTNAGGWDAFVTKLTPIGTLSYSTYLGGSRGESGHGIAVDGDGNAYITGATGSSNFPTLNPFQPTGAGGVDAFATKLTSSGAISYSTYLGGSSGDSGYGIAVDGNGNAYITGETESLTFPVLNPSQPTNAGGWDAFVTKLTPIGTLSYSTYLGGSSYDWGFGIAADGNGNAYITGLTLSLNFPTLNASQPTKADQGDAFVTKLADEVATPPNPLVPAAPRNMVAEPGPSLGEISLSWEAPESDGGLPITNYRIYARIGAGPEDLATQVGNVHDYVDSGRGDGVTVSYRVSAVNAAGEGARSAWVSATTLAAFSFVRDTKLPLMFIHGIDPPISIDPGHDLASYFGTAPDDLQAMGWTSDRLVWGYYVCNEYQSSGYAGYRSLDIYGTHAGAHLDTHKASCTADACQGTGVASLQACWEAAATPGALSHTRDTPIEHLALHWAWATWENYGRAGKCINVIAHSMGGLVVRYGLQQVGSADFPPLSDDHGGRFCVKHVVTFGTPHEGTEVKCGMSTQCRQMQTGSTFLAGLDQSPAGFSGTRWALIGSDTYYEPLPTTWCVGSLGGRECVPPGSATGMTGASQRVVYHADSGVGHGEYFDRPAFDRTARVYFDRTEFPFDVSAWSQQSDTYWPVRWAHHAMAYPNAGCGSGTESPISYWPLDLGDILHGEPWPGPGCSYAYQVPPDVSIMTVELALAVQLPGSYDVALEYDSSSWALSSCTSTADHIQCQVSDPPDGPWRLTVTGGYPFALRVQTQ